MKTVMGSLQVESEKETWKPALHTGRLWGRSPGLLLVTLKDLFLELEPWSTGHARKEATKRDSGPSEGRKAGELVHWNRLEAPGTIREMQPRVKEGP